jgi:2-dehydro-3-deoxyphosphogluconate aldolase / (4S)-4-hydroxy-2-oxoglutarate aldolase
MPETFPAALADELHRTGVLAVLMIEDAAWAVPVARALLAGGVNAMELTLRTPVALDALRHIRAEVPEMIVGAGTVLSPAQVEEVHAAGAAFAVAPGTNGRVIAAARGLSLPFAPGICTPTDIEAALEHGCRWLKFFPSEACGGLSYLRQIAAPYAHLGLRYIPLGGLNESNMGTYLSEPFIGAIGGSWLAPKEVMQRGDWAAVTARAVAARAQVVATRGLRACAP